MAKRVSKSKDVVLEEEYQRASIAVQVKQRLITAIEYKDFKGRISKQKVVDLIEQTVV